MRGLFIMDGGLFYDLFWKWSEIRENLSNDSVCKSNVPVLMLKYISRNPKDLAIRRLFRKKTGILWVTRHTAAHAIFVERIDPI